MSTIIKYNGKNPFLFDSEQYSPLISRDTTITQLDQRWNSVDRYVLNGSVHACGGFSKLLEYQRQIINGFNADYKTLEIDQETDFYNSNDTFSNWVVLGTGAKSIIQSEMLVGATLIGDGVELSGYPIVSGKRYRIIFRTDQGGGSNEFALRVGSQIITNLSFQTDYDLTFTATDSGDLEIFQEFSVVGQIEIVNFSIKNVEEVWSRDFCKVLSINFPENNYSSILPFSITLECYPKDFFKSNYYVINPVDSWVFTENKDQTLNVTREIGAKGLRDGKQGIENAKSFVLAQKEINKISPTFLCRDYNLCLENSSETINRITGEYSLNQSFIADINKKTTNILRYTVDESDSGDGIVSVSISGDLKGCKNLNFEQLRTEFNTLSIFSLANQVYNIDGSKYLNPNPISESISENEKDRVINFNYTFDNQQKSNIYVKFSVAIDESLESIKTTVYGEIKGNKKYKVTFQEIQDKYNTFNPFPYALDVFNTYVSIFNNKGVLYPNIIQKSKTEIPFNKAIKFSYTYTNNKTNEDNIFKNFNSSASITPATNKFAEKTYIDNKILVVNLNSYNRCNISISGSATSKKGVSKATVISNIESKVLNLFNEYGKSTRAVLESKNIKNSFDDKNWNYSFSWSFENSVIHNTDYTTVNVSSYI